MLPKGQGTTQENVNFDNIIDLMMKMLRFCSVHNKMKVSTYVHISFISSYDYPISYSF